MLKLTLIVGIIGLLNFTNFDLGSNTLLNNSLATENTQSQESTLIEDTSNPDSTQSKEIYTVQKANLGATDSFDPDAIPYFRTETSTYSNSAASITINNHWTSTIKAVFTLTNGSIYNNYNINPGSSTILYISNETVDLTISAIDKNGFRNWAYKGNGFIETSGESQSQFASFVHIPDMRYFTTDASGTRADDYFFNHFFRESKATSLPEGSFDISTITQVGECFFLSFNDTGSLTTLPANSFDTSNIKYADECIFAQFNNAGSLTVLPKNSFNFDAIETLQDFSFTDFNLSGSLASLPYNSFDLANISASNWRSFWDFNYGGKLTKYDWGVKIKNIADAPETFYWATSPNYSSSNTSIDSMSLFIAYAMDVVLSFNSNGGSAVDPVDGVTGFKFTKPSNPTKSGYQFIQWVLKDGTAYDWDSTATDNLTLYAQWEEVPSPTPTTSPTESPTTSPTPTKSPTSSPSPSSSNSLPVTGDDSGNIFTFGGISLFVGMILLTLTLINRRSKRITDQENYKGNCKD